MKTVLVFWLICLLVLPAAFAGDGKMTAGDVVSMAWAYMRGRTSVSVVQMTIHRPEWERKTTIKAWTRGRENSIFQIIAPKKDRGNGTLKLGRKMWIYNPKINRVIKIPPSMMSQSWMGSDFSNNDLSKADAVLVDYTHEITGIEEQGGLRVYTIRALPRPDAPVVWGMQTLKIREDGILMAQIFHDEDFEPVKMMETCDIRDMGGRPFPAKWTMRKMDGRGRDAYTLVEYKDLEFDLPLKAGLFALSSLKRPMR